MKQEQFTILENTPIAKDTYKMVLGGDTTALCRPGQFINLQVDGFFLRRPISVSDWDDESLTILYQVVGGGTAAMARLPRGAVLDALSGLGNGFDTAPAGRAPLLIGGGLGFAPLYRLCRVLRAQGAQPTVILGFPEAAQVCYEQEFRALGAAVYVATADGSYGVRGFVTDVMAGLEYTYFYTCGPEAMFRAIDRIAKTSGQYSFDSRMGCGFGACMGCSCKTLTGNKRICREGPVLRREEILWER